MPTVDSGEGKMTVEYVLMGIVVLLIIALIVYFVTKLAYG